MKMFQRERNFKHCTSKKRVCMFTALFALFSLFSSRAYIGKSELEVQVSQQLRLLDQKIIGQEWEWARNISIVYTWVNGSESEFRARRILNGGNKFGGGSLDRDNNELLYSLRSLSMYLPWHTGKIYIVTQNQIPSWLNTSNSRIQIVDHSAIIPQKYLPTYNSNVIDSYLYLIPGLTDLFIYFNDDVFVRSSLHPSDLFTSGHGLKLFVDDFTIPFNKTPQKNIIDRVKDTVYWRAFFRTVQLLVETYETEGLKPLRILKHTPHVFHRGAVEQIHHLWAEELKLAHTNKFRTDNDILFIYAYYGYLVHQGLTCCNLKRETFESQGHGDRITFLDDKNLNLQAIEKLRGQPTQKFLNLNDNMGHGATSVDAVKQLAAFLHDEFGSIKSPFEF